MTPARKIERITGRVVLASVRRATASEHAGVVLETDDGERLILVRLGANPFKDPETEKLSGSIVTVEGYRVGRELRYVSVQKAK